MNVAIRDVIGEAWGSYKNDDDTSVKDKDSAEAAPKLHIISKDGPVREAEEFIASTLPEQPLFIKHKVENSSGVNGFVYNDGFETIRNGWIDKRIANERLEVLEGLLEQINSPHKISDLNAAFKIQRTNNLGMTHKSAFESLLADYCTRLNTQIGSNRNDEQEKELKEKLAGLIERDMIKIRKNVATYDAIDHSISNGLRYTGYSSLAYSNIIKPYFANKLQERTIFKAYMEAAAAGTDLTSKRQLMQKAASGLGQKTATGAAVDTIETEAKELAKRTMAVRKAIANGALSPKAITNAFDAKPTGWLTKLISSTSKGSASIAGKVLSFAGGKSLFLLKGIGKLIPFIGPAMLIVDIGLTIRNFAGKDNDNSWQGKGDDTWITSCIKGLGYGTKYAWNKATA